MTATILIESSLADFGERKIPVAISMAGGYAPKVEDIVDIYFATIEIACLKSIKNQSTKPNIAGQ